MGDKLRLINPAHEMALEVRENLSNLALLKKNNLKSSNKFIVSDKEKISKRFLKYGRQFLKLNELKFEEKNIFINE
jgi:glutamate racemase